MGWGGGGGGGGGDLWIFFSPMVNISFANLCSLANSLLNLQNVADWKKKTLKINRQLFSYLIDVFQAEISNIIWFQLLKCEDLPFL